MMSVSGHTDEKTFREYIKLSLDERAEGVKLSSTDGMFWPENNYQKTNPKNVFLFGRNFWDIFIIFVVETCW